MRRAGSTSTAVEFSAGRVRRSQHPSLRRCLHLKPWGAERAHINLRTGVLASGALYVVVRILGTLLGSFGALLGNRGALLGRLGASRGAPEHNARGRSDVVPLVFVVQVPLVVVRQVVVVVDGHDIFVHQLCVLAVVGHELVVLDVSSE